MNRKLSPKSVESAVNGGVYDAVRWAVEWAMSIRPDHPNIDKFIMEIEQKWSVG